MKCSDISTEKILEFLAGRQGSWTMAWDIWKEIGDEIPSKLKLAKMKKIHEKGLVGGCSCGCRGDFEITDKGLEFIGRPRIKKYTGY